MNPTSPPPLPSRNYSLPIALGILGAAVFSFLIYVGVQQRVKREKERKAIEEFNQTRRDVGAEMKRDLDQNGAVSADTAAKAIDKMRSQIDTMVTAGGKEDKTMKAVSEVMAELQAKAAPYIAFVKRIEAE